MNRRRVVVTGIGAVTPLGNNFAQSMQSLREAKTGLGPITLFDPREWPCRVGGQIRDFDPRPYFRIPKAIKLTERRTQFAVAAAAMALADAGLQSGQDDEIGVCVGTGVSDQQPQELARAIGLDPESRAATDVPYFSERILSNLQPLWLVVNLPNMVSAHVAIQLEIQGPNNTLMTDWIAGSQALGEAYRAIQHGEAQIMLAGGADSGIYPQAVVSYSQAQLFNGQKEEPQFALGEGAAFMALEDHEHAVERGARIYGELVGYACGCVSLSVEDSHGLAGTIETAMREASWKPAEIDAICAASIPHPSFTQAEKTALTRVFDGNLNRIALFEFKSRIGHTLAASGPIEAALALSCLASLGRTARMLCTNLGLLGQTSALAFQIFPDGRGESK